MLHIAILFTGGTIGSADQTGTVNVDRRVSQRLLAAYENRYGGMARFYPEYPLNMLSENMTPAHWVPLCEAVNEVDASAFDGVIVAHGSDTLAYSAALLGLLFGYTRVPMVLVAAGAAPDQPGSNAVDNLHDAVCFIRSAICGVFVAYDHVIHLATRLLPADSYRDCFGDYGGEPFGTIRDEQFCYKACPQNPTLAEMAAPRERMFPMLPSFEQPALLLSAYPGLDYTTVSLRGAERVVLHLLYHSATACTGEGGCSLPAFVKRCKAAGVKVYAASFKDAEGAQYATTQELVKAGIVPLENISAEAAYVKMLIAYNQHLIKPDKLMKKNWYYEILPKK